MTTNFLSLKLANLRTELLIIHNGIDNLYPNKNVLVKPKLTINKTEITFENYYKTRYQLIKEALIEVVKIYRINLKEGIKIQNKLTI